ncbi:MAG: hypothetical protein ABI813_09515 [Bacteroidota bacterium]
MQILCQIAEHIQQKNLLGQYRYGLRSMFIDLFVNAANQRYLNETEYILKLQRQFQLFDKKEVGRLERYRWLRKGKLYRLPFMQRIFFNSLQQLLPVFNPTLNKVPYTDNIAF